MSGPLNTTGGADAALGSNAGAGVCLVLKTGFSAGVGADAGADLIGGVGGLIEGDLLHGAGNGIRGPRGVLLYGLRWAGIL